MERQKEKVECIWEKKEKIFIVEVKNLSQVSEVKPKQLEKNQPFINTWQVIMGVFQKTKALENFFKLTYLKHRRRR